MIKSLAVWLFFKLSIQDGGALRAPGAKLSKLEEERDGRKVFILSKGDAFELYFGRRAPIAVSLSPRVVLSLVVWVLWRYWVLGTWCGVKVRIWNWALGSVVGAKGDVEQTAPDHLRQS